MALKLRCLHCHPNTTTLLTQIKIRYVLGGKYQCLHENLVTSHHYCCIFFNHYSFFSRNSVLSHLLSASLLS